MKLVDLNPRWVSNGGEGMSYENGDPVPFRDRVAVTFDCPCGCGVPCTIQFRNPPDGGPPVAPAAATWERLGDTFATLDLKPSILRTPPRGCGWHGYVNHGEIQTL